MTTRRGSTGRPQRATSKAELRKDLLVFVEGDRTEEDYLVFWHQEHRRHINVRVDEIRGSPMTLVKAALDAQREARRDEKRGRGRAYDEIWCVFDVDEHPSLGEAINIALQNEIHIAVSNPCIELWFILHFQDQTAYIEREPAQRRSKGLLSCDKVLTRTALQTLYDRYADARTRAMRLDNKHKGDGSEDRANPSSGVWRIIDSIKAGVEHAGSNRARA